MEKSGLGREAKAKGSDGNTQFTSGECPSGSTVAKSQQVNQNLLNGSEMSQESRPVSCSQRGCVQGREWGLPAEAALRDAMICCYLCLGAPAFLNFRAWRLLKLHLSS